jgi:predicted ATPase
VLVGPNNAGKTNVVEAIDFLGDSYRYGLEIAISRKGGYENVALRRQRRTKAPLAFTVTGQIPLSDVRRASPGRTLPPGLTRNSLLTITHHFSISARRSLDSDYKVETETFQVALTDNGEHPLVDIARTPSSQLDVKLGPGADSSFWREVIYPLNDPQVRTRLQPADTELFAASRSFYVGPIIAQFTRDLGSTRAFQVAPPAAREAGVSTPAPDLGRHGQNLPGFIRFMRKNSTAWDQVMSVMRRVVPNLDDIRPGFTSDRRLALRFYEEGLSRPWSSEEISDGTLRSLALLATLFDPRSRLTLVEEPENSLHPWVIRQFVEACRQVRDKQVILTTHSPTLLDCLEPHEVVVVSREDGYTRLRRLSDLAPETVGLWRDGTAKLSEMLDAGLVPQAAPMA